jgi:hypothetical protein
MKSSPNRGQKSPQTILYGTGLISSSSAAVAATALGPRRPGKFGVAIPGAGQFELWKANKAAHEFWASAVTGVLNQAISPTRVAIADRIWFVFAFDSAQAPVDHQ